MRLPPGMTPGGSQGPSRPARDVACHFLSWKRPISDGRRWSVIAVGEPLTPIVRHGRVPPPHARRARLDQRPNLPVVRLFSHRWSW